MKTERKAIIAENNFTMLHSSKRFTSYFPILIIVFQLFSFLSLVNRIIQGCTLKFYEILIEFLDRLLKNFKFYEVNKF